MAKKSKTQRAKASAARQAKKEQAQKIEELGGSQLAETAEAKPAEQKKSLFKRSTDASEKSIERQSEEKAPAKKNDKNAKPSIFKRAIGFFKDVRSELKRVTWPTRQDVLRWSAVVVVALLFFGIYVVILDGIVTQILVGISGLSNFVQ